MLENLVINLMVENLQQTVTESAAVVGYSFRSLLERNKT